MFKIVLMQTIMLSFRKGGGAMSCLAFYILVFTVFAFALSPEALAKYAVAVMCVALLMASVAAQGFIFEHDYEDGMIEQYIVKSDVLELVILAKMLGQWFTQLVPILIMVPFMAIMAGFPDERIGEACLLMLLLSPGIVALSVLTASLTVGSRSGAILPALIILPLLIPPLIFASSMEGQQAALMLAAFACAAVPACCYLSAALLRQS